MFKTQNIFFLSLAVFIVLLFVLPREFIPMERGSTILTITTFLFGIIAGFYIVVTTTDYNSMKNILASETAGWIALYENMLLYDAEAAAQLSELVDTYVIRNFDHEVIDYVKVTEKEFENILVMVRALPRKQELSWVHENIRELMDTTIMARQQLTVLGSKTLSVFQWS